MNKVIPYNQEKKDVSFHSAQICSHKQLSLHNFSPLKLCPTALQVKNLIYSKKCFNLENFTRLALKQFKAKQNFKSTVDDTLPYDRQFNKIP